MTQSGMMAIELHGATHSDSRALTDETLLRQIVEGKEEGLQELVRRYQSPIHRFLTRFLGSSEDAEQATLNVFIRAWQNAPRFQYRAKVSTWLYRIAINIARDMHSARTARLRRESSPEALALTHPLVGNAEEEAMRRMEQDDQYRQLQRALDRMSEIERTLLILYYFEDSSYEEMQAISGLSYKVLKTRLSRARQRLRALLEQEAGNTSL